MYNDKQKGKMKTKIIAAAMLTMLLASCEKGLEREPAINASTETTILEHERPVVHMSRSEATDMFIPCQAVIDGVPVTVLNVAGTTLQNMPSQDIHLPRLSPGKHEIEMVWGKARKLYRDAEAACGEREGSAKLSIDVMESTAHVLVLTAARTDVDRYIFLPDEGRAVEWNTRRSVPVAEMTVSPDIYTVRAYPSDEIVLSAVGEKLDVRKTETLIGRGIDITVKGTLEKGKENSRFTVTSGGQDYVIQVAN